MAEILSRISGISFGLAIVFFLMAVFFWFKFGILTIIGDLSGRTARKSIAKIRENNEKSGKKNYRPSRINVERGKLTERMVQTPANTGNMGNKRQTGGEGSEATALLAQNGMPAAVQGREGASGNNETVHPMDRVSGREAVSDNNETAPLTGQAFHQRRGIGSVELQTVIQAEGWRLLGNIRLIHTDEMID